MLKPIGALLGHLLAGGATSSLLMACSSSPPAQSQTGAFADCSITKTFADPITYRQRTEPGGTPLVAGVLDVEAARCEATWTTAPDGRRTYTIVGWKKDGSAGSMVAVAADGSIQGLRLDTFDVRPADFNLEGSAEAGPGYHTAAAVSEDVVSVEAAIKTVYLPSGDSPIDLSENVVVFRAEHIKQ